jgi:hypothetical protein
MKLIDQPTQRYELFLGIMRCKIYEISKPCKTKLHHERHPSEGGALSFCHQPLSTKNISRQRGKQMSEERILNGVDVDAVAGLINAVKEKPDLANCKFRANNEWIDGGHNRTTITGFYGAGQEISHAKPFVLDADEPPILAGQDKGANPVEHLLNALVT